MFDSDSNEVDVMLIHNNSEANHTHSSTLRIIMSNNHEKTSFVIITMTIVELLSKRDLFPFWQHKVLQELLLLYIYTQFI